MRSAVLLSCLLPLATAAAAASNGYWYEPAPKGADETELAALRTSNAFGTVDARVTALTAFSQAHPGTAGSGLAQLEIGWLLLDDRRPAEALAALRQADVARTALGDYALVAQARALEATNDDAQAAAAYVAAAGALAGGPAACPALLSGGEAWLRAKRPEDAVQTLTRLLEVCRPATPEALEALSRAQEARGDLKAAAALLDRLDRSYPASPQARQAAPRLAALARHLPRLPAEEVRQRQLVKAEALLDSGLEHEALALLRPLERQVRADDSGDRLRLALGRALAATGRRREALAEWSKVRPGSPSEAQAAFRRARLLERDEDQVTAYEDVISRFSNTRFAEQALLALAQHHQKDAQHEAALPYYRRLLDAFPDGTWARQASWFVAWGEFRQGHYEAAAEAFERAARRWPDARETPAFLYWAGRARESLGQLDVAAAVFAETVRRYKHAYHGMRAAEGLRRLPPLPVAPDPSPTPGVGLEWTNPPDIPEPALTRVRQLFLLGRTEEAIAELGTVPATPLATATIGWLEWRRGRLRPAIVAMKRAYPWYVSEAGDALPIEMWRILYPLEFGEALTVKAARERLDPTLVAALICQESTFDPGALSAAGARGLMQIIPQTGRQIARELGVRFRPHDLSDPAVSLDFGTRYLAGLLERYGNRIDRALAAYNAGPHRVDQWTATEPDMPSEVFVETIPFSETRHYVATVLANQAHYGRIYPLAPRTQAARSVSQP